MEPQQMQQMLANAPKQFCEGTICGFNGEAVILGLTSGNAANFYGLTPENAKRLAIQLTKNIELFEKKVRKIDETQKIPTPFEFPAPDKDQK